MPCARHNNYEQKRKKDPLKKYRGKCGIQECDKKWKVVMTFGLKGYTVELKLCNEHYNIVEFRILRDMEGYV